jgi:lipopolysaccharide biosynthesis glycosyltransferase
MIHSALSLTAGVTVHFLCPDGLSTGTRTKLSRLIEGLGGTVEFIEVAAARIEGLPGWDYIPASMWNRIFLPELLPGIDRVLYLDVDTIVMDDLGPLFETDVLGSYVAAVTNVFQLNHLHRLGALGIDDPRDYFNSGVLLMNLDLMRRDDCSAAIRDYARAGRSMLWPDQDALNAVLGKRRVHLHPRWNVMNSVLAFPWSVYAFGADAVAEARSRPGIRHFEGPAINKPWHLLCEWPMREAYFHHRQATPWPDAAIEGRTPAGLARHYGRRIARHRRGKRSRTTA